MKKNNLLDAATALKITKESYKHLYEERAEAIVNGVLDRVKRRAEEGATYLTYLILDEDNIAGILVPATNTLKDLGYKVTLKDEENYSVRLIISWE